MTESDISRIEHELSVQLPPAYATLLRRYPFSGESCAAESYLWNDFRLLLERNRDLASIIGNAQSSVAQQACMFQIGCDGGEVNYLIDLRNPASPIYVYDFESGSIAEKCQGFDAWIAYCRDVEAEVVADEAAMAEREANRRWWEFWK